MITGNHDEAILALAQGNQYPDFHPRDHHQWLAERIDPRFVPLLAELPRRLVSEYVGKKLLLVHYHITEDNLTVPIDRHPWLPIDRVPTLERLEEFYADTDYDAVLFGHHHPLHQFESEHRLYLNPGALGCNPRPLAPYAILHVNEDEIRAEVREVAYENGEFLASYERLQVPDREFILKIFHGNQHLK